MKKLANFMNSIIRVFSLIGTVLLIGYVILLNAEDMGLVDEIGYNKGLYNSYGTNFRILSSSENKDFEKEFTTFAENI